MKLQRSTLILLLLALTLGTGVLIYERRTGNTPATSEAQGGGQELFAFQEDQVLAFTVRAGKQTLSFERSPQGKPTTWLMKTPKALPANDASVAFLLNLLATSSSERTLSVEPAQIKDFGLDTPEATVEVTLKDQKKHTLSLGKPTFDQRSLYAQVDADARSENRLQVQLVSTNFGNAVNRPLADWEQPKPPIPGATPTIPVPNAPIPTMPPSQPQQP